MSRMMDNSNSSSISCKKWYKPNYYTKRPFVHPGIGYVFSLGVIRSLHLGFYYPAAWGSDLYPVPSVPWPTIVFRNLPFDLSYPNSLKVLCPFGICISQAYNTYFGSVSWNFARSSSRNIFTGDFPASFTMGLFCASAKLFFPAKLIANPLQNSLAV